VKVHGHQVLSLCCRVGLSLWPWGRDAAPAHAHRKEGVGQRHGAGCFGAGVGQPMLPWCPCSPCCHGAGAGQPHPPCCPQACTCPCARSGRMRQAACLQASWAVSYLAAVRARLRQGSGAWCDHGGGKQEGKAGQGQVRAGQGRVHPPVTQGSCKCHNLRLRSSGSQHQRPGRAALRKATHRAWRRC